MTKTSHRQNMEAAGASAGTAGLQGPNAAGDAVQGLNATHANATPVGRGRGGIEVMRRLIVLVRPLTGWMLLAIGLGLAGHLAAWAITVLGGYGLITVVDPGASPFSGYVLPLVIMGVCGALRGMLRYGEQACNHFIAFTLLALIRDRVFLALRRLAPAKLEGRGKGDLISVITSDIELLEVFYAHTVSPAAIALLFSLIVTGFLAGIDFGLALIAAAAYVCVGAVAPWLISRSTGSRGLSFRAGAGELSGFILDSLRGLDEIQQFGCGAERLRQMDARDAALADDERVLKRAAGAGTGAVSAVIIAFDMVMLGACAVMTMDGTLTFAQAMVAQLAFMGSFGPVVALANLGSTLQGTFAAGNRVLDILDEEPVCHDVIGMEKVGFSGAAAREVSFAYDGADVLRGVSLDAPEGAIVGVCGKSGSGKSTLLRLFMRFWDVERGSIEVSGRSVGAINTSNLRDLESLVTQETQLFHDTVRNNVRIAKLDATDEEVELACRKASIHDFIVSLPQGYETQVGELGDTLSGGERQRLGLARAFLHDAPFMLLDEPTSNVDSLNEGVILRSLREGREGKTVLLVSHRASTMRVADSVVSVENGRVS